MFHVALVALLLNSFVGETWFDCYYSCVSNDQIRNALLLGLPLASIGLIHH